MVPSSFDCDSDIRISYPFPNDENMWAFWAAHDCTDYSLLLTLVFSEESIAKVVGFHGAELSSKGCSASTAFNGAFTCEFELDIARQGFGLLFMGGFTPVFHLTEWQQETDWEDTFNWW